MSLNFWSHFEV